MKVVFLFDLDGTVAKWNCDASVEDTFAPGYFRNREPETKLIKAINKLAKDPEVLCNDIRALTSVYPIQYCKDDKKTWLKENELGDFAVEFIDYGQPKSDYIIDNENQVSILLDDFTKNLKDWETNDNCFGIKFLNGINSTKGTWEGLVLSANMDTDAMYFTLKAIINQLAKNYNIQKQKEAA